MFSEKIRHVMLDNDTQGQTEPSSSSEPQQPDEPPPPPGGIYYHYTSRELAQEISISGEIRPSNDGYVYLTDVLYQIGWQATDSLALPSTKAEVAIPVKIERSVAWAGTITPLRNPGGSFSRRGGGQQWIIAGPVNIAPYPWIWMELEAP